MEQKQFIGIDFGTTTTAVYGIIKDEFGIRPKSYGENGFPFSSVMAIPKDSNSDKIIFGRNVKQKSQELSQTHRIIKSMKSYLDTDEKFIIGNKRYTAIDVTAAFLSHIKKYMKKIHNIELNSATMAFPVGFSPVARRNLKKAAQRAGIKINGFVSESTAAYIASRDITKAYKKVMVIDWGGGTLDISILRIDGPSVYEEAVYGEQIGGDDIDNLIAYNVHARLVNKTGTAISFDDMSPEEKDQLINICEQAKIEFSNYDDDYPITLRNYGEFGTKVEKITFDTFEEIVTPVIKDKVLNVIDTAMQKAGTTAAGIDVVVMSGGSSELRPFEKAIMNIFKDKVILPKDAQWAVAKGAAMLAMSGSKLYLNDNVGVVMSDMSVYPVLIKNQDYAGIKKPPIAFALMEDSYSAQFVFANSNNTALYGTLDVKTKGYLGEKLKLEASIDDSQIATIIIKNRAIGENYSEKIEFNKLPFYYNLMDLPE